MTRLAIALTPRRFIVACPGKDIAAGSFDPDRDAMIYAENKTAQIIASGRFQFTGSTSYQSPNIYFPAQSVPPNIEFGIERADGSIVERMFSDIVLSDVYYYSGNNVSIIIGRDYFNFFSNKDDFRAFHYIVITRPE